MVILSLFDGMSCGQIALRELGVTIDKYYASEIDKFAIQNTMANFPDTVQLGDVRQVDAKSLGKIDLLIGGSPCQCFSFAGKRAGMSTKRRNQADKPEPLTRTPAPIPTIPTLCCRWQTPGPDDWTRWPH